MLGQLTDVNPLSTEIFGHLGDGESQVAGRIILVEVDKILQERERLVFGGITEANARTGPAPTVSVRTFAIKRSTSVLLAQHPVESDQLIPP